MIVSSGTTCLSALCSLQGKVLLCIESSEVLWPMFFNPLLHILVIALSVWDYQQKGHQLTNAPCLGRSGFCIGYRVREKTALHIHSGLGKVVIRPVFFWISWPSRNIVVQLQHLSSKFGWWTEDSEALDFFVQVGDTWHPFFVDIGEDKLTTAISMPLFHQNWNLRFATWRHGCGGK